MYREFEDRFGVVITEGYGLSETSPVARLKPYAAAARPGLIGAAIPGVEMELITPDGWDPIEWTSEAIGEIATSQIFEDAITN